MIALGGNALQKGKNISPMQQLKICKITSKAIIGLLEKGHSIAIVHGNGPQIGEIIASSETAHKADKKHTLYPMDVCNAFTQGYIGYHLQNSLNEALRSSGIIKKAVTVITQIKVYEDDPAFKRPTKPIGRFYTKEEAMSLMKIEKNQMKEDAGRGWRRVVASPKPIDIVEKDIIKLIFESDNVVISCGGGGIPVVEMEKGVYKGVEAVIDKDYAASKLAQLLEIDILLILTNVDEVYLHFNKKNQKALKRVSSKDLNTYIKQGHFGEGSMLPKILAAKEFVESGTDRKSIITSLSNADKAFGTGIGTLIY